MSTAKDLNHIQQLIAKEILHLCVFKFKACDNKDLITALDYVKEKLGAIK